MTLQEFIHKFEVGSGNRYIRHTLMTLAVVTLVVVYNWRCFHDMSNEEAMDSAQVARNITEGRGFTTYFIRGLSIRLVKEKNEGKNNAVLPALDNDDERLKGMHPDLANPPVYPYLLAGW